MLLARQIENFAMLKFKNDKQKVICYLGKKCQQMARRSDSYYGTKWHMKANQLYRAYSSALFTASYWYSYLLDLTDGYDY